MMKAYIETAILSSSPYHTRRTNGEILVVSYSIESLVPHTERPDRNTQYMTSNELIFRAGFLGCAHLGYRMADMARLHSSGLNLREVDGYLTHDTVYRDMIASGVQLIVDGGDTFHYSSPTPRAISEAIKADDLRVDSRINSIRNTGNHDVGSGTTVSAVASIHRPALGSHGVFPDHDRIEDQKFGPHPGLYEIHQPDPDVPLYLHVVSHPGLDPNLRTKGIVIEPEPVAGGVNILMAHGIFAADDRLFGACDRHGPTRLIPADWVNRGFDASILSDYHTPGPIPGFGPDDGRHTEQVWMTGSLIGRGFADDLCDRGWLQVDITADGAVNITQRTVWKRPQMDFDVIDCENRTVDQINEIIRSRLAASDWWDRQTAEITGDGGWILRQRIRGANPTQRHGIRSLAEEWVVAAGRAAYWGYTFENTDAAAAAPKENSRSIGRRGATINYLNDFADRTDAGRVGAVFAGLPGEIREQALKRVTGLLADVT